MNNRKQNYFEEYIINGKSYKLHIFDKISTPEEAYLIGYLLGDGGLNSEKNNPKNRLNRIYVSSINKEVIEGFQKCFCPDNEISSKIPINKKRNIKTNKLSYTLHFSSKFSKSFNNFGILNIKKDRNFANIPQKFMPDFLLGLFDSDGFISWGRRKDRNRLWADIGIVHQSIKSLEKIQNFLSNKLNISSALKQKGTENCYLLRFSNREKVFEFVNYIYSSNSSIYNKEKKERAMQFIKEFNDLPN